jgi:hypothetical protein
MISVDNRQGRVSKVTCATFCQSRRHRSDRFNETLVTTTVLNHSARHPRHPGELTGAHRLRPTSTSRSSSWKSREGRARHLAAPDPPVAFVNALSENGIDLELMFWVAGPQAGVQAPRSGVNRRILKAFSDNGIAIPAPRRDIRYSTGEPPAGTPGGDVGREAGVR